MFDVYRENLIKNAERKLHGSSNTIQYKDIKAKQLVIKWQAFLNSTSNKTSLIDFLVKEWKLEKNIARLNEKMLLVTSGIICHKLSSQGCSYVSELESNQEEADTRLLLHTAHVSRSGFQTAIVVADDTDVLMMLIAFQKEIRIPIYFKCGTKARVKYIEIQKIVNALGEHVSEAILGMHSFTGCDSVSTFAGRGKLSSLKLLKNNFQVQDTFCELGKQWTVTPALFSKLEAFVCQLYSAKTTTTDVNELRYCIFASKKGQIEPHQLPPCGNALQKHICRANYQAAIWRRS